MSDVNQTPVTDPTTAAPSPIGKEQTPSTEGTPKAQPDQLGSQFAALGRREKALRAQEQQIKSQQEQVQASLKQVQELEGLSADEILERIASRKGRTAEDLIRDYIAKKTGAPSEEDILKESKDPAVQALAKKLADQERANKELQEKLEARSKSEEQAQVRANIQAVQNECLTSATTAWTDDSDFPLFFTDQADLANGVFSYCANRVREYENENGFPPDESDLEALIKAAPKLIFDEILKSPKGQRILGLKSKVVETPPPKGSKPRLNVPAVVPPVPDNKPQPVRTRIDHDEDLANAKRRLG